MDKLLIDTNVVVRYLKSVDGILADVMGHYQLMISSVTVVELMTSNRANDQTARQQMMDFINDNFEIIDVNKDVAVKAGDILRSLDITLAHALTAASAILEDIPLVTYEMTIFDRVPDLKLVDM